MLFLKFLLLLNGASKGCNVVDIIMLYKSVADCDTQVNCHVITVYPRAIPFWASSRQITHTIYAKAIYPTTWPLAKVPGSSMWDTCLLSDCLSFSESGGGNDHELCQGRPADRRSTACTEIFYRFYGFVTNKNMADCNACWKSQYICKTFAGKKSELSY